MRDRKRERKYMYIYYACERGRERQRKREIGIETEREGERQIKRERERERERASERGERVCVHPIRCCIAEAPASVPPLTSPSGIQRKKQSRPSVAAWLPLLTQAPQPESGRLLGDCLSGHHQVQVIYINDVSYVIQYVVFFLWVII